MLLTERAAEYAVMTLDRPERRNALSVALRDAISDALDELGAEPDLKAVIVTGAGPVFSAGFDLKEFERAATDEAFNAELWASSDRFHRTVLSFALPLVAAVNGPAVAGPRRARPDQGQGLAPGRIRSRQPDADAVDRTALGSRAALLVSPGRLVG